MLSIQKYEATCELNGTIKVKDIFKRYIGQFLDKNIGSIDKQLYLAIIKQADRNSISKDIYIVVFYYYKYENINHWGRRIYRYHPV